MNLTSPQRPLAAPLFPGRSQTLQAHCEGFPRHLGHSLLALVRLSLYAGIKSYNNDQLLPKVTALILAGADPLLIAWYGERKISLVQGAMGRAYHRNLKLLKAFWKLASIQTSTPPRRPVAR